MTYTMVRYARQDRIATITLDRPEKYNTLRPAMWEELEDAVGAANRDREVRVIVLEGAGDSFCAGFDFSGGLAHYEGLSEEEWDPGTDAMWVTNPFTGPIPKFMQIWRGAKPVIAKVQGWCVGGGSELALCADLVIASEDARFGTPYARVWGCHLTGMWLYRLGLTRAKELALSGRDLSGVEAAAIGLVNRAVPFEDLEETVRAEAEALARIPLTQLAAMKLIVNQAYESMGLHGTQILGPILDGLMRNTPEGREFVEVAQAEGVGEAIRRRDGPFGDYSQAPPQEKPRRRGRS
jgi:enoyl-CoA hydratase